MGSLVAWALIVIGLLRVTRFLVALIEEPRDLAARLREARRAHDSAAA